MSSSRLAELLCDLHRCMEEAEGRADRRNAALREQSVGPTERILFDALSAYGSAHRSEQASGCSDPVEYHENPRRRGGFEFNSAAAPLAPPEHARSIAGWLRSAHHSPEHAALGTEYWIG